MGTLAQEIRLRGDPAELWVMRDFVSRWARRCALPEEDRFTACLVATEAVTNAMRHGCPDEGDECPITVACRLDGSELVIEVTDRGRFRGEPDRSEDDSGGRGLFLIRELTTGFRLNAGDDGTHLWMRLPANSPVLAGSHAA